MSKNPLWLCLTIGLFFTACEGYRRSVEKRSDSYLLIVAFDHAAQLPLQLISDKVSEFYGFNVITDIQTELPAEFLNHEKGKRYNAAGLLNYLNRKKADSVAIIMALTGEDIYISKRDKDGKIKKPEEKYRVWGIFGLAHRPGVSCIVSSHRIRTADENKFRDRLLKITLHEIGHNLGLRHCANKKCLMTDAVEKMSTVDNAALNLCKSCLARIN